MKKLEMKSLTLRNFTVFPEAHLEFSPRLNVFAGENGSGKSHLLKLAYSILNVSAGGALRNGNEAFTKSEMSKALADKLLHVFRPDSLGRLPTRRRSRERCEIRAAFGNPAYDLAFTFASNSQREVSLETVPGKLIPKPPVFLPTRELLTIYPGFVPLYESRYLEFEETWRDTCLLLGTPLLRGPREARIKELLEPLEDSMGGAIVEKNGRFYLKVRGQGSMEMPLVAEGLRKLGMVARLIATGALLDQGYLFWDEPETNLNPKLIKEVAHTVLHLAREGIQVFVASHSLFFMRELDILLSGEEFQGVPARFFGMHPTSKGYDVLQGDSIDAIGAIASLDEELHQSDRFLSLGAAHDEGR